MIIKMMLALKIENVVEMLTKKVDTKYKLREVLCKTINIICAINSTWSI